MIIELEYQDPDGALVHAESRRLLDFFDTLQEACEAYPPVGEDVEWPSRIRAKNYARRPN